MGPVLEEVLFRLLPTMLLAETLRSQSSEKQRTRSILTIAVISSIIFGLFHGALINILFQGVSGFILFFVFLKCGGYKKQYAHALCASVAVHSSYNAMVLPMIILLTYLN
ncbi:MAG: CPBP family intramembrane metalloprotease [Parcubacteria group bacterium]|nr:CPBP family intramembrane metalloprotease [Parcubacteria group bacterium]